jgi:hypothetical protein
MAHKNEHAAGAEQVTTIAQGYAFDGPALEFGALVADGTGGPDV